MYIRCKQKLRCISVQWILMIRLKSFTCNLISLFSDPCLSLLFHELFLLQWWPLSKRGYNISGNFLSYNVSDKNKTSHSTSLLSLPIFRPSAKHMGGLFVHLTCSIFSTWRLWVYSKQYLEESWVDINHKTFICCSLPDGSHWTWQKR